MCNKVESLIAEVNDWCQSVEDHLQSEDCMYAEFCQTFGYGDDKPDLSRLEDDLVVQVKQLRPLCRDKQAFRDKLVECSELVLVGMFIQENEIYSTCIGEHEEQLPDELWVKIVELNAEDFEKLRRAVDCHIPDERDGRCGYAYFNGDYDRWVLILDVDKLAEAIAEVQS